MDIKIDFMYFEEKTLKVKLQEIPTKVFVNFNFIEGISQDDFQKLNKIYDKFSKSDLFFVNVSDNLTKQLRFLLNRNEKIRIIPNEVKRNKRTSNE